MKVARRSFAALCTAALAVTGVLVAAPPAPAASNPSIVVFTITYPPIACTWLTGTSVRMNTGDAFHLHNDAASVVGPRYSIDGVEQPGFIMPGQDVPISFSDLGTHSVDVASCGTISVSVVAEPVEGPAVHDDLQQVGVPASGDCADVPAWVGHLPGFPIGGWSKSWAQWVNDGAGGPVCTRTVQERPDGTDVLIG